MTNIPPQISSIKQAIDEELLKIPDRNKISLFYDPIQYINSLQGKRLRPLLTIVSGLALKGNIESLLFPAIAIELLHNFTLVHDDIMDNDSLRRGNETVHVKWDIGTGILAGDGLLGFAYQKLLCTPNVEVGKLAKLFTNTLIDICEGQAMDKSFESESIVSESEYLDMINKKTAVLIKLSCQIGALTANADEFMINAFADFGYNIGMGFQIQDDLLDVIAEESLLGKKVGSDLAMHKKTILTTKLAETGKSYDTIDDLKTFKHILAEEGIISQVQVMAENYFTKAYNLFDAIEDNEYKMILRYLADYIKNREK